MDEAVLFLQCMHAHCMLVPVLIQKSCEKLLHCHLPDSIYIQIRQNARDVVQQNAVASDNIEILRAELFVIII